MFKRIFLLVPILFVLSCASNNKSKNDFNNYLLNDKIVIYTLKKNVTHNSEVNIFDSKKYLNQNEEKSYMLDNTKINFTSSSASADYILTEYVLNKDLAFLAFLKKGENKVLCFLFNKGKHKGKWILIEKFEKLNV